MTSLQRKLLRDLWNMRGQWLAIAVVVASGICTYLMAHSTRQSLELTRSQYYATQRFADIFVPLKRAPETVAGQLRRLPGVDTLETRVTADIRVEVTGFSDPIRGRILSIPAGRQPTLNALFLRAGRLLEPDRPDELILAYGFAAAHGITLGARLHITINGRTRAFSVVGIADSPEFIYVLPPGSLVPDFARYGIAWMNEQALAAAVDMDGAFNDVLIRTTLNADESTLIKQLDTLLARYGGVGAYRRENQLSHRYLHEELRQLGNLARVMPIVFLGVAAFLLNIVVARLIATQREQIAVLKAFGYRDRDIGWHYLAMAGLVFLLGAVAGIGIGAWLGQGMTRIYVEFFQLPILRYRLSAAVIAQAVLIAGVAVALGATHSVRRAVRLPPAEAMRPAAPTGYHLSALERLPMLKRLSQVSRMILRNLTARPLRTSLSVLGIAFSCAIVMMGRYQEDAISHMVSVQFGLAQREDLSVTLTHPVSDQAVFETRTIPGVIHAEGYYSLPVRLRHRHHEYRTSVRGFPAGHQLRQVLTDDLHRARIPESGLLLTDQLGRLLDVEVGDRVTLELLDGSRRIIEEPVAGLVRDYIGVSAYMSRAALARANREGGRVSEIAVLTDPALDSAVISALRDRPVVAGIGRAERSLQSFYETMAETLLIFNAIFTVLAGSIAFGVVYNNSRILMSERSRELASLGVLGYRQGEIRHILLGELALLTLLAIPLGYAIGYGLVLLLSESLTSDLYRVPAIVTTGTLGFSGGVVLAAAALSGWGLKRRLDSLDLIEVLKARE